MFRRRPKFTPAQRLQLDLLIAGELEYLNDDAPVCMFDTDEEAGALLAVIHANSKKEEE